MVWTWEAELGLTLRAVAAVSTVARPCVTLQRVVVYNTVHVENINTKEVNKSTESTYITHVAVHYWNRTIYKHQ